MSIETRKSRRFFVHSIGVEIIGPGADRLAKDYDFFTDRSVLAGEDSTLSVTLEILPIEPNEGDLPEKKADQIFPDCVLYREGNSLTFDYFGQAHLQIDRHEQSSYGILKCNDSSLVEEIGFLFLQTEISRFLDRLGLHRIQALGIGLPSGKAALILLPKGGGKSTLAMELLKHKGFTLLSDESPLVDRLGNIHPYPLRLSFRIDADIPKSWKDASSVLERKKLPPRLLVPVSLLAPEHLPRLNEYFSPGFLVICSRHGAKVEPKLHPLSRFKSALPLVRDLVVGYGLPKMSESFAHPKNLPGLAPQTASRLAAATAFAVRTKTFQLELSRNPERNADILVKTLEKLSG